MQTKKFLAVGLIALALGARLAHAQTASDSAPAQTMPGDFTPAPNAQGVEPQGIEGPQPGGEPQASALAAGGPAGVAEAQAASGTPSWLEVGTGVVIVTGVACAVACFGGSHGTPSTSAVSTGR